MTRLIYNGLRPFALEPALPLREGDCHTSSSQSLFGSFADCAPDTWGRLLLKWDEAALANPSSGR